MTGPSESGATKRSPVLVERRSGVALVTVDHPPVNALGAETFSALEEVGQELLSDEETRVVVLTGAGEKAFMAGADIEEFEQLQATPDGMPERTKWASSILAMWAQLPQPVIAAVQASAVGGGLEMALLCDLIVADEKARLGLPEVRLGLIPAGGGTQRLARRVGIARAKEMMMLGSLLRAGEAKKIGLVDHLADPGASREAALALAEEIAQRPRVAVQAIKRVVEAGSQTDLQTGLEIERQAFFEAADSEDFAEGFRAFLEKRTPDYKHR